MCSDVLDGERGAQCPLQVGLHGLQLSTPVTPAVGACVGKVEHTVFAARGEVVVLEGEVGALGEAFQELRIAEVEGVGPGVEVRRGAGANYWRMSWQPGKQDILVVRLVSI
jgi:hypothetical protein